MNWFPQEKFRMFHFDTGWSFLWSWFRFYLATNILPGKIQSPIGLNRGKNRPNIEKKAALWSYIYIYIWWTYGSLHKAEKFINNSFDDNWQPCDIVRSIPLPCEFENVIFFYRFFFCIFQNMSKIGSFRLQTHSRDAHIKYFWGSLLKFKSKFLLNGTLWGR